ncbi:MAG: hypothetical protein IJJ14_02890 [Coriobacteriales bacterium]|nr:hypothetical protein [Coriobacteriales bacterium]MBQ6585618.1 hypothetical protein [Coriobacteriales bacterium]
MEFDLEDVELDDYEEFEDDEPEEDEEEEVQQVGYVEEPEEEKEVWRPHRTPNWTDEEKIEILVSKMPGRKKVLLQTIEFMREPRTSSECDKAIDGFQHDNYSVYSAVTLRRLLEENGAIKYIAPQEREQNKPAIDEDGNMIVTKAPEGKWVATEAGINYLESVDRYQELADLLEMDAEYIEIYKRILRFCAEEPRDKTEIDDLVDDDPLLQKPRRYSGYFVARLEKCDAMEWKGDWITTEVGKSIL